MRLRKVSAVIQAVVESEGARDKPRFVLHRPASTAPLIVATDEMGPAFTATALQRADYAQLLGQAVVRLASEDPLPSQRRIHEALAQVPAPEGDDPHSIDRLLHLAVAVVPTKVALSSRLELYPVGLPAERALRLGGGALLSADRLDEKALRTRIQSRFPRAEPLPPRPKLDRLLEAAEVPIVWHEQDDLGRAGYGPKRPPGTGLTRISSSLKPPSTRTLYAERDGPEEIAVLQFGKALDNALREGRVLIVTHDLGTLKQASAALARVFGLSPISLDAMLIAQMHAVAQQVGINWSKILEADSTDRQSRDWHRLQALIARAFPAVRQQLLDEPRPLLIENIGLLVRYSQTELLQSLRDAAQRSPKPARIILIPGDAERSAPVLDKAALPVITPADFTVLPRSWVRRNLGQPAPQIS